MNIESFICPISQEMMSDPVMTKYGHLYERKYIEQWVTENGTCPMTNQKLGLGDLIPAYSVRNAIQEYKKMKQNIKQSQ